MNDQIERFANDYANATTVHPLALAMLVLAGALMFVLPRRWAIAPLIALACFIPAGQRLVIVSIDFTFLRLMLMLAISVAFLRRADQNFKWTGLDSLFCLWVFLGVLMPILKQAFMPEAGQSLNSSKQGLIYFLGIAFDWAAMYFVFRLFVQDWADVSRLAVTLMVLAVPVSVAFAVEWLTHKNAFSIFGGVPETTMIREGRLRCQGAFAHPILAGCFWACAMPMMGAMFAHAGWRSISFIGLTCAGIIVMACSSSTPVMAILVGIIGLILYPMRNYVRYGFFASLLGLCMAGMIMKKPVWHLIARIDVVSGSTGYHRYALINGAVNHADEWAMMGSNLGSEHWGRGLFDVTNYYIAQGLQGGLPLLLTFLAINAVAFIYVGQLCRISDLTAQRRLMAWALGVAVAQHAINLIGVSYFGQVWLIWFAALGVVGSLTAYQRRQLAETSVDFEGVPSLVDARMQPAFLN